jgi:hypothetical protein
MRRAKSMFQRFSLCIRAGRRVRAPGLQSREAASCRPGAFTRRLDIARISRRQEVNPKGIPSLSPGLRAASYPGCGPSRESPTLKGLQQATGFGRVGAVAVRCCNPFRVGNGSGTQPRVARCSQPWAERYNPFGIEPRHADLRLMASTEGVDRAVKTIAKHV